MKKSYVGVGHGGKDSGGIANGLIEKTVNLVQAWECNDVLKRHNVNTMLSRSFDIEESLRDKINECNEFDPDVAIDVHNNIGGGNGCEFFYSNGSIEGKKLALLLEKHLIAIGQNSRGVKTKLDSKGKDFYGFVRDTKAPAVVVEGFFMDSTDKEIGDTVEEQKKFGQAYAKAILEYFNIPYKDDIPVNKDILYRVQVGAFKNKLNADKLAVELKQRGYSVLIKEEII